MDNVDNLDNVDKNNNSNLVDDSTLVNVDNVDNLSNKESSNLVDDSSLDNVDNVDNVDNEDVEETINYTTFEDRNLQHGDFVYDVKVIKANNPIQLSIKGDKPVYVYQFGSMDFAFEEENLAIGIHALHRVFKVPSCPVKYCQCQCGKIF